MATHPQMVGNYQIVAQLGQGGMARAFLAIRQGAGGFRKLFVVKQLRVDLCDDPEFVKMFLNEARLAALLNHPNVVQTHEVGEDINSHFISMEYLEGQSLGRLRHRAGATHMSLNLHVGIIANVLAGLHYAHELKDLNGDPLEVVHRDISPGNIIVTYDGRVKLLDFGIAKIGAQTEAKSGVLKGKLSYMAPEQAQVTDVDCRADIFSIGVLLWEAMTGRLLVPKNQTDTVTFNNRTKGLWESIDLACPDAPEELRTICSKAMAMKADDRFQTAAEFRQALLSYLSQCNEPPANEEVATLICELFGKERAQMAKTVAQSIAIDHSVAMDSSTFDLWNAASSQSSPIAIPAPTPLAQHSVDDDDEPEIEIIGADPTPKKRRLMVGLVVVGACAMVGSAFIVLNKDEPTQALATDSSKPLAASQPTRPNASSVHSKDSNPSTLPSPVPATLPSQVPATLPSQVPATLPSQVPATVATTTTADTINLVVRILPSTATIQLDGTPLSNPFVGIRERDPGEHLLVFSAPGHETSSHSVYFREDSEWKLELKKTPLSKRSSIRRSRGLSTRTREQRALLEQKRTAEAEAEAEAKKPTPSAKVKMGDDLSKKKKAVHEIDRNNPYD